MQLHANTVNTINMGSENTGKYISGTCNFSHANTNEQSCPDIARKPQGVPSKKQNSGGSNARPADDNIRAPGAGVILKLQIHYFTHQAPVLWNTRVSERTDTSLAEYYIYRVCLSVLSALNICASRAMGVFKPFNLLIINSRRKSL